MEQASEEDRGQGKPDAWRTDICKKKKSEIIFFLLLFLQYFWK